VLHSVSCPVFQTSLQLLIGTNALAYFCHNNSKFYTIGTQDETGRKLAPNVIKITNVPNKLECSSLASLSSLV
jgi:hypothetical protein